MREYAVIIEKGANCWGGYCPDLPGLAATGATPEEVERLMAEGLRFHLESMLEDGDPIPEGTTRVGTLQTDIVESYRSRLPRSA